MEQTTIMGILAVLVIVILIAVIYYLKHHQKVPQKPETSGVDLNKLLICLKGKENIQAVEANGSKITVTLKDVRQIDDEGLKALGASGIVSSRDRVTLIFGKASEALAKELADLLS